MLKHSIALQSIGKGYPNFSVFQQKWNIPQTGWPPCNLTFAISPRFSTLHFNSLEMSLALTLSKSVMLSGSNVFQTKTNKTKGNRGNLERLSNYYKRKERAHKGRDYCKNRETLNNLWRATCKDHFPQENKAVRRQESRFQKYWNPVKNNSSSKIKGHTFPRTPEILLPWHDIPSRLHSSCAAFQEPALNSGHSADIPYLSEEKSVSNLLLGTTSLFILLSKAWTSPTDKSKSHRTLCHQWPRVTH